MEVGRNEPCPCGSGRKYKKCCQGKRKTWSVGTVILAVLFGLIAVVGAYALWMGITSSQPPASASRRVWSPEHGHYHDVR